MRVCRSAEECSETETGFNTSGLEFQMIGIDARTDNFQVSDLDWPEKWRVNFGELQHEPGTSSLIAKPRSDCALHHRRRKQNLRAASASRMTPRASSGLFRNGMANVLDRNRGGGKAHHSGFGGW